MFAEQGEDKAVAWLTRFLADSDNQSKRAAAEWLGRNGGRNASEGGSSPQEIARSISSVDNPQAKAAAVIAALPESVQEAVVKAAAHKAPAVAAKAVLETVDDDVMAEAQFEHAAGCAGVKPHPVKPDPVVVAPWRKALDKIVHDFQVFEAIVHQVEKSEDSHQAALAWHEAHGKIGELLMVCQQYEPVPNSPEGLFA